MSEKNLFDNIGANIWIIKDMDCKSYTGKERIKVKKYSKGKILEDIGFNSVVVELEEGTTVIIKKKDILINLPDVLQDQVVYEIVNAKSAIYNIHGNSIPEVTGVKLYEYNQVPLMYKTAEKLYLAENEALQQGFTIKIYDTYRPYSVTKYLYEKTSKVAEQYKEFLNGKVGDFEYSQRWFLAEKASSHNYGAAMDITLLDLETGKELEMQSKMHDLSIFSVVDNNNKQANKLRKIMLKYGFTPLRSEWWHFQDNDSKIEVMDFQPGAKREQFAKGLRVEQDGTTINNEINVRNIDENDIEQIVEARIAQETEYGHKITKEYIETYRKVIEKLFQENKVIGAGAFDKDKLVSLAFFNFISFGDTKQIPYMCGVWTDEQYRGQKLASRVNKKLMEGLADRKNQIQTKALLTLEGNEAAYNLYKKLGYVPINGEMSFLGDVSPINLGDVNQKQIIGEGNCDKTIYSKNGVEIMKIEYSNEQFFAHPSNLDGKMNRIIGINILQENMQIEEFETYMQQFFYEHRFCKFNIQELIKNDSLIKVFSVANNDIEELMRKFEEMSFEGVNGESLNIKKSDSVMQKNIEKELEIGR